MFGILDKTIAYKLGQYHWIRELQLKLMLQFYEINILIP